jgi:hypothetical protein
MAVRTYRSAPQVRDASGTWHRPSLSRTSKGGTAEHTAICPCGLTGPVRTARDLAMSDLREHLAQASPVPAERRCHAPREHHRQAWEECSLCADQISLFDDDSTTTTNATTTGTEGGAR